MIEYYTDGATEGHNKLGQTKFCGIGIVCPEKEIEYSKRIPAISSNEAEFWALIVGMKLALLNNHTRARFLLDSSIVVNRAYGNKPKKKKYQNNRMDALQDKVLALKEEFEEIEFVWIPREKNWHADSLSKLCLHEANKNKYERV